MRSAKLTYQGEEVDLCLCRTKAQFSEEVMKKGKKKRILTLEPVEIEFSTLTLKLQTKVIFEEGSSNIQIQRHILEMSDPAAKVELNEYMVACYGTTEYPEDMMGIQLACTKGRIQRHQLRVQVQRRKSGRSRKRQCSNSSN